LGGALSAAALAVLCAAAGAGGCAGALENPAQFVYLLEDGGEGTADAGSDAGGNGAADAGQDGGDTDAGADGGKDAGPSDSGPRDAGADAGPRDGGADAGFDGGVHDGGTGCNPVTLFFGPTCATGLCHSADTQQALLDLASPGMPGRLVGRASNGYPGLLLIDPVNPDNSLLYTKTLAVPPGGFQMPLALDPLTDIESACLLDWVRKAAANP
jgi:hypothetical protein